jgi:hypothetical protein
MVIPKRKTAILRVLGTHNPVWKCWFSFRNKDEPGYFQVLHRIDGPARIIKPQVVTDEEWRIEWYIDDTLQNWSYKSI